MCLPRSTSFINHLRESSQNSPMLTHTKRCCDDPRSFFNMQEGTKNVHCHFAWVPLRISWLAHHPVAQDPSNNSHAPQRTVSGFPTQARQCRRAHQHCRSGIYTNSIRGRLGLGHTLFFLSSCFCFRILHTRRQQHHPGFHTVAVLTEKPTWTLQQAQRNEG